MKKNVSFLLLISLSFLFTKCGDHQDKYSEFPIDKKYWTADDYYAVNVQLTSLNADKAELPNLDNPATSAIFNKITDTTNFSVISNDAQLGLSHKNEALGNMFKEYKEIVGQYSVMDRQDKYKYPVELVDILNFGLSLNVPYIFLGNEKITKDADNPNAPEVLDVTKRNLQILISNYNLYIDYINYEDRFSEKALVKYAEGIGKYFPLLINELIPGGDYSEMLERVNNMLKKAKNPLITAQLENLKNLLTVKTSEKH